MRQELWQPIEDETVWDEGEPVDTKAAMEGVALDTSVGAARPPLCRSGVCGGPGGRRRWRRSPKRSQVSSTIWDTSLRTSLYRACAIFFGHNIDGMAYKLAKEKYMLLIDFTISWFVIYCEMAIVTAFLSMRGIMPSVFRLFIMTENCTYFWTSLAALFWISHTVVTIVSTTPSLMFNIM